MLEFGSDFHLINNYKVDHSIEGFYNDAILLANGRHSIELLIQENTWSRIWMPEYYCYEVVDSIAKHGVEICFYKDYPGNNDQSIPWPHFKEGDVLLRMNYFGHRCFRDEKDIPIPVIEDHSHSPFGPWAMNSNADWCIASLRKTLPIAEGGILWSPKKLKLPNLVKQTDQNQELSSMRWLAMKEKACYLRGEFTDKSSYRKKFLLSEEMFNRLPLSLIDKQSSKILENFDINEWFENKYRNWLSLASIHSDSYKVQLPEDGCESFSFVILCDNKKKRDRMKIWLIENNVYPAILWDVPSNVSTEVRSFSERMLSIHCDARYSEDDIVELKNIILYSLQNV